MLTIFKNFNNSKDIKNLYQKAWNNLKNVVNQSCFLVFSNVFNHFSIIFPKQLRRIFYLKIWGKSLERKVKQKQNKLFFFSLEKSQIWESQKYWKNKNVFKSRLQNRTKNVVMLLPKYIIILNFCPLPSFVFRCTLT